MSTSSLFSPIQIGNLSLKHRVVLAPLARFRNGPGNVPAELVAEYYYQRASEGGLLITEATLITARAGRFPKVPGIWSPEQIAGWRKVTDRVHEKKGYIFNQIWHLGRTAIQDADPDGYQVVSASNIAVKGNNFNGKPYNTPRALEIDEIKSIVQDYRQAALNAIEAGFDGVEIHGANGYLIDQFINTSSNKRTDIYGGPIENRARFALEVLEAVVEAVGAERTGIRFSPGGDFQDMADDTAVETWSYLTSEIQKRHPNLAYLHFIETRNDSFGDGTESIDNLQPFRALWKGPFISAGGFSNNIKAAIDIADDTGNLIGFGRVFIANPDLPERLRNGWELNKYDRSTFYTDGPEGYIDYPFYKQ